MARIVYKNKANKRVPGTTGITGELGWNTGVLINWANRMGLEGIETGKYVDNLADVGQLGHQLVMDEIRGVETDLSKYTPEQVNLAQGCLVSYKSWKARQKIEPILMEEPLVSEEYQFGGTMDFYGLVDGLRTIVDYKSGRGIYDEHHIQVGGGYRILCEENGYGVDQVLILNIPRGGGESFQVVNLTAEYCEICRKIFINAREIYALHRSMKGGV